MGFSTIFDILDAKECYDDIADFVNDKKNGKTYKNERRVPSLVLALLALGSAASLLLIALDWIETTSDLDTVRVHPPVAVADAESQTNPAPEAERAARCARDPFLDICK